MVMKIGIDVFKEWVLQGIDNEFMRGVVLGVQECLWIWCFEVVEELGNWEEWCLLLEEIRQYVFENFDFYFGQFVENVVKRGGYVYFVEILEEVFFYICDVI